MQSGCGEVRGIGNAKESRIAFLILEDALNYRNHKAKVILSVNIGIILPLAKPIPYRCCLLGDLEGGPSAWETAIDLLSWRREPTTLPFLIPFATAALPSALVLLRCFARAAGVVV